LILSKFSASRVGALILAGLCFHHVALAAAARNAKPAVLSAVAKDANVSYCFARVRRLDVERLPQAYLALRLRVTVSYHNDGTRAVIVPLERKRTIFTALKPGQMSVFKPGPDLFDPTYKPMNVLPRR
jgi:hypothetical protein